MMHEVEAVILAGGYGKRMRELTANRQKCMFVVDGKPILAHILDNLQIAFGSVKVIILTGFKGGEVKNFFGSKLGNIQIEYTSDSGLLGTRKAILQARDQIKGPFFVIGGDVIAHPHQYERMVNDYHPDLFGETSAATDHRPAPTHAVIYTDSSNKIFKIQLFPMRRRSRQLRRLNIQDRGLEGKWRKEIKIETLLLSLEEAFIGQKEK